MFIIALCAIIIIFRMLVVRDFFTADGRPCCNYAKQLVFLLVVCEKPPTCLSEVKDNTSETDS